VGCLGGFQARHRLRFSVVTVFQQPKRHNFYLRDIFENPAKERPAIAAKFSPKLDLELIPLK